MHRKHILSNLIRRNDFRNVVELGVWKGTTFKYVVDLHPHVKYTGIDRYAVNLLGEETYKPGENGHAWDHEQYYKDMLAYCADKPNARIVRMDTAEAAFRVPDRSVDLVFIDASHDYESVKRDIAAWLSKIRDFGIISGHDYSERFRGVIDAVEDMGLNPVTILDDTVWMKRVRVTGC